jgi:hypothetical protein
METGKETGKRNVRGAILGEENGRMAGTIMPARSYGPKEKLDIRIN